MVVTAATVLGFCVPLSAAAPDIPAYAQELMDKARTKNLADQRRWRLLGHYRGTWWGGVR